MKDFLVSAFALRLWLSLQLQRLLDRLDPPPPPEDFRQAYRGKCDRVVWTEPGEAEGTHITRSCSIAEAIARQRASGLRYKHHYATDREALEDFLAIHWAEADGLDLSSLD